MPRPPPSVVLDKIRHKLGEFEVRYDKTSHDFFVRLPDDTCVRGKEAALCIKEATAKLDALVTLTWIPYILVDPDTGEETRGNSSNWIDTYLTRCEIQFKRVEVAAAPWVGTGFLERAHTLDMASEDPATKERWRTGRIRARHHPNSGWVKLPYDEKAWFALCSIQEAIKAQQQRLAAVLKNKNLMHLLQIHVGNELPVLPSGTKTKKVRKK